MEQVEPGIAPAATDNPLGCELLILHTAEAQEWAAYLQMILKSSQQFQKSSILLYAVSQADELHAYNFENFQSSKCIVLLLTAAFLELLTDPELRGGLQCLLYPPHRVVALLCGVSEEHIITENFEHWPLWRKLYADDDPFLYVSTILESIDTSTQEEVKQSPLMNMSDSLAVTDLEVRPDTLVEDQLKETIQEAREEFVLNKIDNAITGDSASSPECVSCLTVQPNRVQCGEQVTVFIILKHKVDQSCVEVEFLSENAASTRVQGTLQNEYTISVAAPDMPSGKVSLVLHTDQFSLNLMSVTYYTNMEEVSRYIENASSPMEFICQAFNLTSNTRESLDNMLTDSLKSRMPPNGLKLFGIRQIEEQNMAASLDQRNDELPTLLHFAAKYGLKKLTTTLLQCPGALQAYSVMNKNGDYPNTLAERSGFSDLRQFIDEFVETADMLKTHIRDSIAEGEDVYESMSSATSQDIIMKLSGQNEDIYESMLGIDPECAEDLYEAINAGGEGQNPEETILRKFFQAKPEADPTQAHVWHQSTKDAQEDGHVDPAEYDEEDPYDLSSDDIYHALDGNDITFSEVHNRPPAPIPRPEVFEESKPYISRVFSVEPARLNTPRERIIYGACPAKTLSSSTLHDPYAGMKTPGQKQLITLQEKVKGGEITVDEAVQEFKAWQLDHERRANSLRYQQENLKRLRDSITRRHKDRVKMGQETEYEISAPVLANPYIRSAVTMECAVYESMPGAIAAPLSRPIQRGSWKTGSTSSTSSNESNRHSTISSGSGAISEQEFEEMESIAPPPRPPRVTEAPPFISPPRIPPRIPERIPESMLDERYISCPTRALPQRPVLGETPPPPVPRRLR